ncbi:hypothetical protein [Paracoccus sp. IB05]|uniref:hypothetical protein n=1 Tax=Paracoccus sp. IB05 TaxID=2779367 RepID=UPI0018E70FAD|nr:hypothetical protein [Paracoccus sp. IB05]MBJ2151458.1 hypothetical protein [Paracoccus sp. IB05]
MDNSAPPAASGRTVPDLPEAARPGLPASGPHISGLHIARPAATGASGPGLARIEPARFLPGEGETTRVTLPGVADTMRVDLLRLGPGLSVALSHFAAGSGMEDLVRWPAGRLLMACNMTGAMAIRDASGISHPIRNGEGWVLHTGAALAPHSASGRGLSQPCDRPGL